ncbi:MAG TPA: amino acid permease [Thermoguttaceae bacterium]|nr:amino acid permease [Thermoguttaceae bacterium]
MSDPTSPDQPAAPRRQLTLFDSTCIFVGIIIGVGIYQFSPSIAGGAYCWWGVLLIWCVGGLISLCGAFLYAELATAYPKEGGDYVYLTRAYGRWAGFLFGWVQLAVVRPADIAVMAFAFAMYAGTIFDPLANLKTSTMEQICACAAVFLLTAINILGVRQGKWTQNSLTVVKVLGLVAIVVVGLAAPTNTTSRIVPDAPTLTAGSFGLPTADGLTSGGRYYYRVAFYEPDTKRTSPPSVSIPVTLGADQNQVTVADLPDDPSSEYSRLRIYRTKANHDDRSEYFLVGKQDLAAAAPPLVDGVSDEALDDKTSKFELQPWHMALIFVLFTFGGWHEMGFVAAEVKNPKRNIVRALLLGTVAVTVLYLLLNAVFLYALGYKGLVFSGAVATDTVSTVFPEIGGRLISVLVCISALGAINGLIFTGARISYAVGADHRVFRALGAWDPKRGTPVRSLLLQGSLAVALIVILGSFIDAVLYMAPVVYLFYLATGLSVIVLRHKEPQVERPYRATGYPVTTLVFCAVCAFLIYAAVTYDPWLSVVAISIVFLGLPLYWFTRKR